MKMAKAPDDEWQKVMDFVNELEAMSEDWQVSDEKIGKFVRSKMPPMLRVCYGYRVLVDNCCNPHSDVLEFKAELAALTQPTA
jgi:hypothetical protein